MQKTITYTLDFLKETHINSILHISHQQLGKGFLSESTLNTYLNNSKKFCHVVLLEQEVVGFSLMEISSLAEIASRMKSEEEWFLEYFAAYKELGYRALTAVSKDFENKGVASFLVKEGLDFLSKKVKIVVCDAWKSDTTHIGNILERNGYQAIREVPLYWTSDSINKQYQCGVCGAPPCECTAVIFVKYFKAQQLLWWERSSLNYQQNYLFFAGHNIHDFVQNKTTPLYIYDVNRIVKKYQELEHALDNYNVNFSIYYALKANRHPAILSHLRIRTNAGVDVCSPNELDWALQHGFNEKQLTYTGTSLSNNDLKKIAEHPQIKVNFDSVSAIRRFMNLGKTRDIGIRINPNVGMAYNQSLEYSGNHLVKFGIYQDKWLELQQLIQKSTLTVTTVHCHCGSGFLSKQLEKLPLVFEQIDAFLELFPTVKTLNLGGGLGVPQNEGDERLDLKKWAAIVCNYAQQKGLNLAFEPGDYLVKDAGILVTQVNTVEEKMGKLFVGIDTGMNMNYEYAYYQMNLEVAPLLQPKNSTKIPITLCGNINEPIDLFAEDKLLPQVQEGDYIALLNSGGYGASTSSNHCMRGDFKEYVLV